MPKTSSPNITRAQNTTHPPFYFTPCCKSFCPSCWEKNIYIHVFSWIAVQCVWLFCTGNIFSLTQICVFFVWQSPLSLWWAGCTPTVSMVIERAKWPQAVALLPNEEVQGRLHPLSAEIQSSCFFLYYWKVSKVTVCCIRYRNASK